MTSNPIAASWQVGQRSDFDCGPAALRTVARLLKAGTAADKLDAVPAPDDEISIGDVQRLAEDAGLKTVAISISYDALVEHVSLPCIAHWRDAHYVVVTRADHSSLTMFDPARGEIEYPVPKFLLGWARDETQRGVVIAIEPVDADE